VYKVKANDPAGRAMTFACGTAEQALEQAQSLAGRGFRDIYVVEPRGQVRTFAAFERLMGE
jgi:hypothetical protein